MTAQLDHSEAVVERQQLINGDGRAAPDASDGPPVKRARVDGGSGGGGGGGGGNDERAEVEGSAGADGSAGVQQQQQQQNDQQQQQQQPAVTRDEPPSDGERAATPAAPAAAAAADAKAPSARDQRLRQRRWWALRRRFADLGAQIEAALCEAKALVAWKAQPRAPRATGALSARDRDVLAAQHNRRLLDAAGRSAAMLARTLMAHKFAGPFSKPVDVSRFPDYPSVISEPMDFGTIRDGAEKGRYRDAGSVFADFMRVFNNGRRYNAPGSDVHHMAAALQESFLEQWRRTVAPKLQECARASAAEEQALVARRLASARADEEREVQDAACRLVATLDDLHEQLAALRVDAALACDPLDPSEREELAAALAALPTAQLEAALGLVLPQMAPHIASGGGAGGGAAQSQGGGTDGGGGGGGGGSAALQRRDVDVDLSRCSALELRQVQSFVGACSAARAEAEAEPEGEGEGGGEGARELSGFPAGVLRDQALSERAGVVWPGVVVGAGLKARHVTLLPGGELLPPGKPGADQQQQQQQQPTPTPPPQQQQQSVAPAAAPPAKQVGMRRASDPGGSAALRPPLPPSSRSRLPPTPTTQAGATPFATAVVAGGGAGGGAALESVDEAPAV